MTFNLFNFVMSLSLGLIRPSARIKTLVLHKILSNRAYNTALNCKSAASVTSTLRLSPSGVSDRLKNPVNFSDGIPRSRPLTRDVIRLALSRVSLKKARFIVPIRMMGKPRRALVLLHRFLILCRFESLLGFLTPESDSDSDGGLVRLLLYILLVFFLVVETGVVFLCLAFVIDGSLLE